MAIEVAGKRFVTLADEFFVNGSKVYEAWANGVKVYPEIGPSYMKITTLPNKLVYKPGDTMDYTGIVCTLFNADGTVYTDERYPDGTIPFEELEFPIDKAPAVGVVYVTDGIPGGLQSFPITLYPEAYVYFYRSESNWFYDFYYPESDAYMVIESIDRKNIFISVVSSRYGAAVIAHHVSHSGEGNRNAITAIYNEYEYDGKTVYYGSTVESVAGSFFTDFFPSSGIGGMNGVDAWNIVYGAHEGDDSSIPVNWTSRYEGDDRVLTDKFSISNREVT